MSMQLPDSVPKSAAGRDYSLLLAMALGVLTIAGAFAMLPGTEEKAAAMIAEGRPGDARSLLEASQIDGELTSYERSMLAELYLGDGDLDLATALLEHLASDPVHASSTLPRLMTIYGQTHDHQRQLATARRLYELRPTHALYARLRVFYRVFGHWREEADFLEAATEAGHASPADMLRLQHLQSVSPAVMATTAVWHKPSYTLPRLDPK